MDADRIRRRIVELDDAVRSLPEDAFAEKHALRTEQDECRSRLRELLGTELDEISAEWAVRAGRKTDDAVAAEESRGAARIVSPTEVGGGGGDA